MLVFLALGNAKVLSFALVVLNANDIASQWNIDLTLWMKGLFGVEWVVWNKIQCS